MKFEHLLQINDPLNPLVEPLTRAQLWRGLILRVQSPTLFVPWLDACHVEPISSTVLKRVLHYGDVQIHDVVTLDNEQAIRHDVPAQKDIAASELNITIEEPASGLLNVRFYYRDDVEEIPGSLDAFYNDHRRSAYRESDIDTIRIIRQMAADGKLDQSH